MQPNPKLIAKSAGHEVWAQWDEEAEIYELFASEQCDDYLGSADTMKEAKELAQRKILEAKFA